MTSKLTKQLEELARLANEAGAEGVFLIREAKDAKLIYTPDIKHPEQPPTGKGQVSVNLSFNLELADAGILVVIRFPTGDGKEAGIEHR